MTPPRIRTPRLLPGPRVPDEPQQSAEPTADPTAGPPAPPRRRRVRMLVDVVDQPDEVAYVTALFEERGWAVRPAQDEEASAVAHRTTLVVEVRLHGARLGALRTATMEVERLVKQAELGAWVRDAALVEHERPARTTYYVHRAGPTLGRVWIWLGGADEQRAVTVPAGPDSRQEAEAELAARDLGGRPFDPAEHALRVPGHSDADPPRDESPHERRVRLVWLGASVAGLLTAIVSGMYVVWAEGAWKLLPALLSTAGALPLGRTAKETRARGTAVQWAVGVAGTTAVAALGALLGQDSEPRQLLTGLLLGAFGLFTGAGVVLAVRRTFFTRHAAWLVPLSVPVLWSMVGWLGGQMHAAYLDRFDIRADAVPTSTLGRYLAAAEPLGLALGSAVFFVAVIGWLRHFHLGRDGSNRLFAVVMATLLGVVFALTAIGIGTRNAASAAGRAAENVGREGTRPPDYFGVYAHFVCVIPVDPDKPLAVDNGPAPTDHPVVSFGTAADWIWLWDPERGNGPKQQESFAVRREDVQLLPADDPAARTC
ncbi:hypothetical protein BN159_5746 [Streptomyces davaonensis JCM 4913]|uniref:Uncharacterized protein n=1 Tax=Streptomyces davaonensis (strain DSM 101723 / JCM 4913 / KCC S-0913 / 768) TaxID=1214101 RepID=K4RAE7_STRDJ|nr:hypothetical protein [Streptomyces davaonensis]CCK30125.1 hypothetical protein BN159_5746 [Streptomyces davaonensis JCM 4913]